MARKTRTLMSVCVTIVFLVFFGGCAGQSTQTKPVTAHGPRTDVFTEAGGDGLSPVGTVDLVITMSLKIPTHDHFLLEKRIPPPTEGGYLFEINIDGQEAIWKVEGKLEVTPISGDQGRAPEGGEGMRYVLDRKIRLAPGEHHVVFGVPYDDYYTEVKISLKEGMVHTLEFAPIYSMGQKGYRTFHRGINRTVVLLDGTRIK